MNSRSSARTTWAAVIATRAFAGGHEVEILGRDPGELDGLTRP